MDAIHFCKRLAVTLLVCSGFWCAGIGSALAQPAGKPALPPLIRRSPAEYLSSPREVLKTLYCSVVAFDLRPQLMDEAVACLDVPPGRTGDPAEAVGLVIELEQILRILCVPINALPERVDQASVVLLDADPFKVSLVRGPDRLWRFDRETVDRIPNMTRAALAHYRSGQADRAQLLDEFTDPSATMHRFVHDMMTRDFYSAANCLDLRLMSNEERSDRGPLLARQLAFVIQRRGWVFLQEIPNQPDGPAYTWHADRSGRIALERVRMPEGKEAWLFSKKTVRNIPAMYEYARNMPADPRFVRLGMDLPPLTAADFQGLNKQRPADVPKHLSSPRAVLEAFFRVMDAAESRDSRLLEALEFLDLQNIPKADRSVQGTKIAIKLEAVLRKIPIELSSLSDDWNAPMEVLGESEGVHVEIARLHDGTWRFSQNTVSQAPAFFDKLAAKDKTEHNHSAQFDSARDCMSTFLTAVRGGAYEQAAECLDLSAFRTGTQEEIGPSLAYKLQYIIDRIGRVYIQEVPDSPDGPRYIFYRGSLGRIVIAHKTDGPRKGNWLFTPDTVNLIESMFRSVYHQSVRDPDTAGKRASFWDTPGVWIREQVPPHLLGLFWHMQIYQWIGLGLALLISALVSRLVLAQVYRIIAVVLHHSGSVLTNQFVSAKLRPLTWVTGWWMLFQLLAYLDLPIRVMDAVLPLKIFGMAGLIAWLGFQIVDLITGIYTNSEFLRPHRSLSDMVVPVTMRALKGVIFLLVAVYVVYQIGEGESLTRFLTGLGVAGLAASLAAQDALKSFFSTLLLIGERSFKIGDTIVVGSQEGVVEQVGFRATRLRTADGSLLTVPNSTITSAAISNLSTKSTDSTKAKKEPAGKVQAA